MAIKHPDGSVTFSKDEAGDLRDIFEAILAGDRIQATLSKTSRERYEKFINLRRTLL